MRRVVVGVVAICAAVAACGGSDDDRLAGPSSTTVRSPSSSAAAAPVTAPPTTVAPSTSAAPPTTGPNGSYTSAIVSRVVDNPAFAALEADVVARVRGANLPGASLLVVHKGVTVEQEAWLQYTLDTAVPIASASKWVSAVTIMTIVDEGTLALDTPISTYLSQLGGTRVGAVTLRQLLSFTSGLANEAKAPCLATGEGTLQTCARQILAQGVVHPPGEAFRYGSQHLHVAAALAEIVTGRSFADLVQQRVLDPLGMARTRFAQIGQGLVSVVTHPLPAGSLVSTLTDYGRFLEVLAHDGVAPDGKRVLTAASLAEMRRNHTDDVVYAAASSFRVTTRGVYGLGHWIDWTYPDGRAMVESSDGKFGFRPWIDVQNQLFGVYLVNDQGSGYVDGDPDAPADDGGKVHTSGLWVFTESAKAVGGALPANFYLHRTATTTR